VGRISSHQVNPPSLAQRSDYVLDNAVNELLLRRAIDQLLERPHRDRRLIGIYKPRERAQCRDRGARRLPLNLGVRNRGVEQVTPSWNGQHKPSTIIPERPTDFYYTLDERIVGHRRIGPKSGEELAL